MYYPADFESRLGFQRIREELLSYAHSTVAKEMVESIQMSRSLNLVQYEIERTDQMRECLMMESDFPRREFHDTRFMERAKIEGNFLVEMELVRLGRALEIAAQICHFFLEGGQKRYPLLYEMAEDVELHEDILRGVRRLVDEHGVMRDNATPQLAEIRHQLHAKNASMGTLLQRILKQAQADGYTASDASVNIRDGRAVIPVDASHKRKIKGFIQGESATGRTAFVEPVEVVELNNELRELEAAEKREVVRILTAFTAWVREDVDDIVSTGDFVGEVDFLLAKARYALRTGSGKPILEDYPVINLRDARHPLLEEHLKAEGREIVPLNLHLNTKERILLISGPNAGGKSVCLKCVGLLQYMMQCGLLVPAKANSQMSIFSEIMIDIGDQQSLDNDLSTYSSHLMNMKFFLKNASENTLILIDEFGGGTEPNIGGAIAEAILEDLRERKTFGVITTHYANLKYYATSADGVANGAMSFDLQNIVPLFSLEQGRAGSSFALEIARKIGLSHDIIRSAQEKVGVDQVNIEKQLKDVARDRRYWENKRERIRQVEKGVERTQEQYENELEKLKAKRTEIIDKARAEAAALVSEANKKIERTIREIREAQAQKEKTALVRRNFEQFREDLSSGDDPSDEITRKMEQLKARKERQAQRKAEKSGREPNANKATPAVQRPVEVGSWVKMQGQSVVGRVVEIVKGQAQVEFGSLITRVKVSRLSVASGDEVRRGEARKAPSTSTLVVGSGYDTLTKRANFEPRIDLRGMRGADGVELVREFIDEALMFGVSEVRILHGTGTGLLKQHIRDSLSSMDGVRRFEDEHVELGGAGITVVYLQ